MAMAEYAPSSSRGDAVFRLLLLLYVFTLYAVVALIGLIGGAVFMVLDVIAQLIWGDMGVSQRGGLSGFGRRLFVWPLDQLRYIALGTGEFPVLP